MAGNSERTHTALRALPPSKQSLTAWVRLLTIAQVVEKEVRKRLRREFATTLPRFDVMAALARSPEGQTMGELSRWLLVSNGNVTGIIARLAKDGLVIRARSPDDARVHRVKLTREGTAEFRRLSRAHEQWIHEILADLRVDDVEALDRLLHDIKHRLGDGTSLTPGKARIEGP